MCRVGDPKAVERLINGIPSEAHQRVDAARKELVTAIESAIRELHWKDFEILVDLVFRAAGWRRISMLGETMKYTDLELEEVVTGDRYQVQVKSSASLHDFQEYAQKFAGRGYRKLYFVVHSPHQDLFQAVREGEGSVELIAPEQLASLVVEAGLVRWVMDKIR